MIEPTLTGQYYQLITLDPPFGVDWIPRILPLITPLQQQWRLIVCGIRTKGIRDQWPPPN